MNIYRGRVDNPEIVQLARDFITGVSLDLNARWHSGHATIQINNIPYRIVKGTVYEKRDSPSDAYIYLAHNSGCTRPDWLTGVLSALAQFYGIDQEPDIINAILDIAVQSAIGQFSSVPGAYIAATFSGIEVSDMAIKKGTNLIAGLCPPEREGEPGIWRLRETGEIVSASVEDGWVTFPITGGL